MRRLPLLLVGLSLATAAGAEKVATMPAPTAYVDDYAGVMSADGKAAVESICRDVHNKTKAQIFFVTIKSLEGESIETFSNDLFHNWKIGEKKTDRGVMLLLAVNDHKRRIEVGYGLEGILPDAKAGRIGMDMVPALKASNYDEAAKVGVQEIADAIAADAKVTLDTNTPLAAIETSADQAAPPPPEPVSSESAAGKWILLLLPFGFFAIFAFFIWRIVRHARRGGSSGIAYSIDGDSFGSSSNSADSSSSSSDSGFSGGDGGDSGGGGASGDW